MIKSFFFIAVICVTSSNNLWSQRYMNQVPQVKRYTAAEIIDPDFGIFVYNKLVAIIGGDSLRYTKDGYNAQGWQEDFYVSGKTLHKGYYVDGSIKVFKNFYENGQVERNYTSSDPRRSKMEIYYEDGKPRSKIEYFEGNTQNQYDFYKNGLPEFVEENDKDVEFLYKRNSYYENGTPSSTFELIDKKQKKYIKKEYYENGRVKEEGNMFLRKELGDYLKEGTWTYYDDKGKVIKTEKYHKGQVES